MITDEMVEKAAEALWVANSKDRFGKWNGLGGEWKDKWRDDARAALTAAIGDAESLEARCIKLGTALLDVYDFMAEDHKSGDSELWTIGYSELFDTVNDALGFLADEQSTTLAVTRHKRESNAS